MTKKVSGQTFEGNKFTIESREYAVIKKHLYYLVELSDELWQVERDFLEIGDLKAQLVDRDLSALKQLATQGKARKINHK